MRDRLCFGRDKTVELEAVQEGRSTTPGNWVKSTVLSSAHPFSLSSEEEHSISTILGAWPGSSVKNPIQVAEPFLPTPRHLRESNRNYEAAGTWFHWDSV